MSLFPIPSYASESTKAAFEAEFFAIRQAAAAKSAAEHAASQAANMDPMTGDVDQAIAVGTSLPRARVDYLRTEIQARRNLEPVFQLLAADAAAELRAAEQELADARRKVETGLRELGFGPLLDQRDTFGNKPGDGLILSSTLVQPANRRYLAAKLVINDTSLRHANREELAKCMERLKAEFAKAANGTPAAPARRRVTEDPVCGLL